MEKMSVLIIVEEDSQDPEVLAVGTEQEVKAKAFELLEDVLCNQGTVIPINSKYGRGFLAKEVDTPYGHKTVRIFIQHR